MADRLPTIRASEIGEYEYCARAWWLRRVQGWATRYPERLQRGEQAHAVHGRVYGQQRRVMLLGIVLIVVALVLLFL